MGVMVVPVMMAMCRVRRQRGQGAKDQRAEKRPHSRLRLS